jgi:hypothetical protein
MLESNPSRNRGRRRGYSDPSGDLVISRGQEKNDTLYEASLGLLPFFDNTALGAPKPVPHGLSDGLFLWFHLT